MTVCRVRNDEWGVRSVVCRVRSVERGGRGWEGRGGREECSEECRVRREEWGGRKGVFGVRSVKVESEE